MSTQRPSRRDFMQAVGLGTIAVAKPLTTSATGNAGSGVNLIVILADDLSARELGCYGHRTHRTPVLDQLAKTGVQFKTCWATPICLPSRAEIMTGRYGFRTGWYDNALQGANLASSHRLFSTLLGDAGYATAVSGKWQLKGAAGEHGFREHCLWAQEKYEGFDGPVEDKSEGRAPGRAARYWHPAIIKNGTPVPTTDRDYGPDIFIEFLLDFVRRNRERRFLAYHPMLLPHISWDFQAKRLGYLPVPEVDKGGRRTGAKAPGSLASNVEYMDTLVGRLVAGLEELGVRQKTVILFTSDNGTTGYGKGSWTMERGPRVPMIVNGPGVKPSVATDALIDLSDVLPTCGALAGVPLPRNYIVDGHSFVPVLRGEARTAREWIFSYVLDRRFLRDERWLLDGRGRFYDCGNRRDEVGYKNVTDSADPTVTAARRRFEAILSKLPPAPPELVRSIRQKGNPLLDTRE